MTERETAQPRPMECREAAPWPARRPASPEGHGPAHESHHDVEQADDRHQHQSGADRVRDGLPRSTIYTLATTRNLVRPPRPATIDALAKGLDVPVSMVRAAAAESTGLHYYDEEPSGPRRSGDQERDLLIASINELSSEDRRHVAALVESLRKKASEQQTGD